MTWTDITVSDPPDMFHCAANCGNGKILFGGEKYTDATYPTIHVSVNYGSSASLQYTGTSKGRVIKFITSGPALLALVESWTDGQGKILKWNSSTSTWDVKYSGSILSWTSGCWVSGTTYLVMSQSSGLLRSTNSGDTFSVIDESVQGIIASNDSGTVVRIVGSGDDLQFYTSADAGSNWTLRQTLTNGGTPEYLQYISTAATPYFIATNYDLSGGVHLYSSSDAVTWTLLGTAPSGSGAALSVVADPLITTKLFISLGGGAGVYLFNTLTSEWTAQAVGIDSYHTEDIVTLLDGDGYGRIVCAGAGGDETYIGMGYLTIETGIPPVFSSIIQSTGPVAGGMPVLITGSYFTGVTAVSFGGTAAADFTVLDDTHIVARTPAHAAGSVTLAITTQAGTTTETAAYVFLDYTDTTIETTVDHGMDDACAKATFEYQGTGVGLSDSDYLARTVITIPDYADVDHVKFVGVCVSGNGTFRLADEKMQLTAYDDFLFLQKKPLDDMDRAVLPADYQTDTNIGRSLNWKSAAHAFAVGYQVWGGTSGARGRILAVDFGTNLLTLAPAYGEFVDSEELYVGDTLYAYADGTSVDIPITTIYGGTVYPEDWLLRILGRTSAWSTTTGVYPEKIVPTTHDSAAIWDTDPTDSRVIYAKPFYFSEESNRYDAAKELTLYLRRILHRKPVSVSGTYYTGLYWVRQSQIDDATYGLDLPSAVTIAAGSPYLASDIDLVSTGDDQYERIHVYSTTLSGKAIDAFYPLAAPTTRYREYKKEYSNYATQADLDDLAEDLYNAMSPRNQTWTVTLYARSDLEVYQKLNLSGFSPRIPDGTYRIIRINPVYGLAVNKVQVWFITNTAFQSQIRLGWTYQDSIQQTVRILERYNSKKITDRPVTYLSQNSDGTWNIQDDTGMVYYGVQDGGTT